MPSDRKPRRQIQYRKPRRYIWAIINLNRFKHRSRSEAKRAIKYLYIKTNSFALTSNRKSNSRSLMHVT